MDLWESARQLLNKWDAYHRGLSNVEYGTANMLGLGPTWDYADTRPAAIGVQGPQAGGYPDALRHLLLAGELQRTHPVLAGPVLWAHENISGFLHDQDTDDKAMDTFNNDLGRRLGQQSGSRQELELKALNALPTAWTLSPLNQRY